MKLTLKSFLCLWLQEVANMVRTMRMMMTAHQSVLSIVVLELWSEACVVARGGPTPEHLAPAGGGEDRCGGDHENGEKIIKKKNFFSLVLGPTWCRPWPRAAPGPAAG